MSRTGCATCVLCLVFAGCVWTNNALNPGAKPCNH